LQKANEKGDGFRNVRTGYVLTLGNEHPILRANVYVNGVKTVIEPFGGESTVAMALNSHGHFVGRADAPMGPQPFIFKDGVVRNLNELIDGPVRFDTPQLIRDDGVIFGTRYIDGGDSGIVRLTPRADDKYNAVELTILHGSVNFNQNGDVIFKSALWRNGQIIPLGDFGVPERVYPHAINSAGQIVGIAATPDDNSYHGFFWDGQMHDMKDLIDLPEGWLPSAIPEDINEHGQIAAVAYTGSSHMLLRLTPKPQITATAATADGTITVSFRAGSGEAVSLQTSTNFKDWTDLKSLSRPDVEETVQTTVSAGGAQFFRINRVAASSQSVPATPR